MLSSCRRLAYQANKPTGHGSPDNRYGLCRIARGKSAAEGSASADLVTRHCDDDLSPRLPTHMRTLSSLTEQSVSSIFFFFFCDASQPPAGAPNVPFHEKASVVPALAYNNIRTDALYIIRSVFDAQLFENVMQIPKQQWFEIYLLISLFLT